MLTRWMDNSANVEWSVECGDMKFIFCSLIRVYTMHDRWSGWIRKRWSSTLCIFKVWIYVLEIILSTYFICIFFFIYIFYTYFIYIHNLYFYLVKIKCNHFYRHTYYYAHCMDSRSLFFLILIAFLKTYAYQVSALTWF